MRIAVTMNDGSRADLGKLSKIADVEYLVEYLLKCGNVSEVVIREEEEDF